jgi:hypothetical protein
LALICVGDTLLFFGGAVCQSNGNPQRMKISAGVADSKNIVLGHGSSRLAALVDPGLAEQHSHTEMFLPWCFFVPAD